MTRVSMEREKKVYCHGAHGVLVEFLELLVRISCSLLPRKRGAFLSRSIAWCV